MKKLLFALAALVLSVAAHASTTYSNVSVSCKESNHPAATTESVSITFGTGAGGVAGGSFSLTGGNLVADDPCAFDLTGQSVTNPFTNQTINFSAASGNTGYVCWSIGFCNGPTTNESLQIQVDPASNPHSTLFTLSSGSITTTFSIPDSTPVAAVPEPGSYALMLAGVGFLGFARKFGKKKAG